MTPGFPSPNGASPRSSAHRSSVSLSARDDRVHLRDGSQVVLGQLCVGMSRKGVREGLDALRPDREGPAAARWPPKRSRCSEQAARPPCRSKAPVDRPDPFHSSPAPAIRTTGRWKRSTRREATIPITPSCQPRPQARNRGGAVSPPASPRPSRAPRGGSALHALPVAVQPLELMRQAAGLVGVLGEQELERRARSGETPRRVDPGREPEADRTLVDASRIDLSRLHERPQARLLRPR